jgi:hypothetical protein
MTTFFAKTGIAALIALSGLAATAPIANAQVYFDNGGPRYDRPHGPRDDYRGPDRRRDDRRRDSCAIGQALDKAERRGLNRPRVADVNPRVVVIVGRNRGGPDRMVFANERGCPSLGR